jgi:hypothetical protein
VAVAPGNAQAEAALPAMIGHDAETHLIRAHAAGRWAASTRTRPRTNACWRGASRSRPRGRSATSELMWAIVNT